MKEQLIKYRTLFDHKANYDRQGLLEAQKEAYRPQIDLRRRIDSHNDQKFKLKPLQIGFVQSLTLKDDPKFISIQKTFETYNQEVLSLKVNPQDGLHLKKVVMESMLKFLRIMMLAPGAESKKVILDISYYWLIKHLNPKSQRKSGQQLNKQIRQIVVQHQLLPQNLIDQVLPSTKMAIDLREYRRGARTAHPELDAPEHELENYQVHKVSYMNQNNDAPLTSAERWKHKLLQVRYDKPNLDQYIHEEEEIAKEQVKIDDLPLEQNAQVQPKTEGQEGTPGQVPAGEEGQPVPQNAQMAAQMDLLNQMGGDPAQQEAQVVIEEEQDKKRGKLDPLVKIFMRKQLAQKQKEGSFEHPPINQLQRYRNNYKEALQRQEEHFSKYMTEWAAKRCRVKTEMARKAQSIRINPNRTAIHSIQNKFQDTFYNTRVNQAIREGRNYVKGQINRQQLRTQTGLSCFDRKRAKTLGSNKNKAFSYILQQNKRVRQQEDGMTQIERIKNKFAKHKIFTSMQAMRGGLMQHEQQQVGEDKVQYPVCLLSNPFFVGKKKKKKGKKKKR